MKILIVNTRHFYGGGDSTYAFNLADLLRANGHQVGFFGMQGPNNLPDENSDLFVSYIDYREMNRRKNPLTAAQVASRSIYSVEARRKFAQLLERVKPDIVHLQNIHAHITPSVIFETKKRQLPVLWTLHDYKLICPNSHFLIDATAKICEACIHGNYLNSVKFRCKKGSLLASTMSAIEAYAHRFMKIHDKVDTFLAPSRFLRSKLIESGFNPEKVTHLPLFLPDWQFENNIIADQGYLLFLGKLEGIKGIGPLLQACSKAGSINLVLAGRVDEPLASQLPSLLPPNAKYVGMKSGEDLRHLIKGARAIVLPSLSYENQPFSILEAFACGKPVIASNLGGMAELVVHGERGYLVEAGNSNQLAEDMAKLSEEPAIARQMGNQAFEYARKNHSEEIHYRFLIEIYTNLPKQAESIQLPMSK